MAIDLTPTPASTTVDLSGLPEPVVQSIQQLVQSLRERMPADAPVATPRRPPLRGRFADLQLSIPRQDIDAAQAAAWAGFPREFPEPAKS